MEDLKENMEAWCEICRKIGKRTKIISDITENVGKIRRHIENLEERICVEKENKNWVVVNNIEVKIDNFKRQKINFIQQILIENEYLQRLTKERDEVEK